MNVKHEKTAKNDCMFLAFPMDLLNGDEELDLKNFASREKLKTSRSTRLI